jgi:hypothetical protein
VACRIPIKGIIDVTIAEAQVVRDGLWMAERIGCNHIYVETDSLEVVQAFMEP